jgi:hypothetical protein
VVAGVFGGSLVTSSLVGYNFGQVHETYSISAAHGFLVCGLQLLVCTMAFNLNGLNFNQSIID